MNDSEIRESFHKKMLRHQHADAETLVLDELGLMHGACRADIAIVNGRLIGYEIKSEKDSLYRLKDQITAYNAIFDGVAIIVTKRHHAAVRLSIPKHWGIILSTKGKRGGINFSVRRKPKKNPHVKPMSVAQLLWRNEAAEILYEIGAPKKLFKLPRRELYRHLSKQLPIEKLKITVRSYFKKRANWRCRPQPSEGGDLFQPTATS